MTRLRWFGCLILLLCFFGCRPRMLPVSSLPPIIKTFEGYASILVASNEEASRSKFSFVVRPPSEARMDVSDTIGRTISQVLIVQAQSFLIIPRKKVFWEGQEEEVFRKALGFSLSLKELTSIFLGREELLSMEKEGTDWEFSRDSEGRIFRGHKGDLEFEIQAFSGQTSLLRIIKFSCGERKTTIRLLGIDFNRPVKESAFALDFLERFDKKTWPEIEALIQR